MTTRQRQEQQTGTYRELIGIAEEVLQSARMVLRNTRKTHGRDMIADMVIAETRKEIEHFCSLGARVIDQSRRRVLNGEQVPTAEKLYSIFEPHTDLIKRGKVQTPIEFGHKVFLAESGRGLITQYEVLDALPTCMEAIAGSSASTTWRRANRMASRWCASHSAAAPKHPSARHMRRAGSSRTANAFAPASRGASRCCSAVAA